MTCIAVEVLCVPAVSAVLCENQTSDSCIVMFLLCLTFQSSLSFCFNEAGVAYIILVGHVGPPSVRL